MRAWRAWREGRAVERAEAAAERRRASKMQKVKGWLAEMAAASPSANQEPEPFQLDLGELPAFSLVRASAEERE